MKIKKKINNDNTKEKKIRENGIYKKVFLTRKKILKLFYIHRNKKKNLYKKKI